MKERMSARPSLPMGVTVSVIDETLTAVICARSTPPATSRMHAAVWLYTNSGSNSIQSPEMMDGYSRYARPSGCPAGL